MAGLEIYCIGGYGRIGVYRVKAIAHRTIKLQYREGYGPNRYLYRE